MLVRLPESTALIVGDAAYHPQRMAERKLPAYLWSPDAVVQSWALLEELERTEDAHLSSRTPRSPQPW